MNNREEQIEQARRLIATGINEDLAMVLFQQFPELKESEDERTRKDLIAFICQFAPEHLKTEYVAYLERQKEQKLVECIEDSVKYKEGFKAGRESGLCDGQKYVLDNLDSYGLCKPAEWSEFDKGALKDAICAADRLGNDESFNKSNPNLAKAFRVAKDWLKSLPERFTLQPEQEVVDRTVFDRIADILRWCDLPIGCPIEDFKQSESEREHLLHIVQCVARRYANSCTYCKEYSRGYQEGLSVPHWKPSEYTLSLVKKVANGEMLTHMEQMTMDTLFNDLQKLLSL